MFWVRNLHPERAIYGNVDITLWRHLPHCAQLTAVLVHGDASLHAAAVVGLVVVPVLIVDGGAVLPSEGRVVGVLVEADPVGVAVLVQLGQQELVLGRVVDGGQVAALVRKMA